MSALTAARNLAGAVWNIAAKLARTSRRRARRGAKQVNESAKSLRAGVRRSRSVQRDAAQRAYGGTVKAARVVDRWRAEAWSTAALEWSVRRELRAAARGSGPIIVGPWLGEVGYEALYWVAFVRWFAEHYRVDPSRLVVVSRGGTAAWYHDVASRYVEILDLFTPAEVADGHARRVAAGDQKQLSAGEFDRQVLARVRAQIGEPDAAVCHPSAMFRLLRRFWLGTASLQHVLDHTRYRTMTDLPAVDCGPLPDRFVAVKFYSGHSLRSDGTARAALRGVLERVRHGRPIVMLDTGLRLDEHEDYGLDGLSSVVDLRGVLTPQNNLGVQTEVIRRAELFVGTCGSLAWLAPMVGTPTVAVYDNDRFLSPHLYAARQIYPVVAAAPFLPIGLNTLAALDGADV